MDAPGNNSQPAAADDVPEGPGVPVRLLSDRRIPDPDRAARWKAWRAENAEAIESSNAWVEKHGLPLAKYRLF